MYLPDKHDILKPYHLNYNEVKKINHMIEIDILRNNKNFWVSKWQI